MQPTSRVLVARVTNLTFPGSECQPLRIGDYPDLHFNRAIVQRYCEDYGPALDGFRVAAQLDPELPWKTEVDAILQVLSKLDDGCSGTGPLFKVGLYKLNAFDP